MEDIILKFFWYGIKQKKTVRPNPSIVIKNSLLDLWKRLQKPAIIMYDDLHYLTDFYPMDLYNLRGNFQKLKEYDYRFKFIFTDISILFSKIHELSEPPMLFFDFIKLNLFTSEEIKKRIYLPSQRLKIDLEFGKDHIEIIHTKTQNNLHCIILFAHHFFKYKSESIFILKFFNLIYKKKLFLLQSTRLMKDLTIVSEKEVLFKIAKSGKKVNIKKNNAPIVCFHLKRLVKTNLINRIGRGTYNPYYPLFRKSLETQA